MKQFKVEITYTVAAFSSQEALVRVIDVLHILAHTDVSLLDSGHCRIVEVKP